MNITNSFNNLNLHVACKFSPVGYRKLMQICGGSGNEDGSAQVIVERNPISNHCVKFCNIAYLHCEMCFFSIPILSCINSLVMEKICLRW